MDLLSGFDFDAAEEAPDAFNYKEIPHDHMQLLAELEAFCRNKNVTGVKEVYTRLRQSNAWPSTLHQPGCAFYVAVESGCEDTVQYLLSEGVEISANHVRIATAMGAKPIIQLLLKYGWPVNKELGWQDPPALA